MKTLEIEMGNMAAALVMLALAAVSVRADWRWGDNTPAPLNGDYNTTANWNSNGNAPNIPTSANGPVYIGIGDYQPGNAGGNQVTINGTAFANGLTVGYNSPNNLLILQSGTLTTNGQFDIGQGGNSYQQTGGNLTLGGGNAYVGNGSSGVATSQFLLDAGTVKTMGYSLSVGYSNNGYLHTATGTTIDTSSSGTQSGGGGELRIGDNATAGATWDFQSGATVYVGGNLYTGVNGNGTVNQSSGTSLIVNNSLQVGYGGSGASVWTQAGGANVVNGEFRLAEGGSANSTYTLNGGSLTVNKVGSTSYISVNGAGTFNQNGGNVYAGKNGQEFVIGYSGNGTWNLGNASNPGAVTEVTGNGGSYVSLRVRLNAGAEGTIQGWGTWGMTGYTYMDGIVRANGFGTDRTLDFSSFASGGNQAIKNNINNNLGEAHGWYAVNHGRLLLPTLTISSGSPTVNWGEDQGDSTLDLINSARLTFSNATAGSLSGALLASDYSTLPAGLVNPVGVWDFSALSGLSFDSVDLVLRYDDLLAAGNEPNLKLFHNTGGLWTLVPSTLDQANNWLTASGVTSFSQFAIATDAVVPEPANLVFLALGAAAALRRQRKRT